MITKEQTDNQNKSLDIIPEATLKRIIQAVKDGKLILLNIKDDNKKEDLVELIHNKCIFDSKSSYHQRFRIERLDCQDEAMEEADILDELDKYIDIDQWEKKNGVSLPEDKRRKYAEAHTLFIRGLSSRIYKENLTRPDSTIAVKLKKLSNKLKDKIKIKDKRNYDRHRYFKLITPDLKKIEKDAIKEHKEFPILKVIKTVEDWYANVNGCMSYTSLEEDDKNDIKNCPNDIRNMKDILKIIRGIRRKKHDGRFHQKYKLIMATLKPIFPCHAFYPSVVISFDGKVPGEFEKEFKGEYEEIKVKNKYGKLKEGGKKEYLSDKELKPLLNGILEEFKGSSHSLSDLAGIARKRIEEEHKLYQRKKDLKMVEHYGVSRLKTFIGNLKKGRPLRYKKSS